MTCVRTRDSTSEARQLSHVICCRSLMLCHVIEFLDKGLIQVSRDKDYTLHVINYYNSGVKSRDRSRDCRLINQTSIHIAPAPV